MEYVTQRFENTKAGLSRKDAYSRQMSAAGYRIVSEQLEAGAYKGGEACCLFATCAPCVFLTGKKPSVLVITYGRELAPCRGCGTTLVQGLGCATCQSNAVQAEAQRAAKEQTLKATVSIVEDLLVRETGTDHSFDWRKQKILYPVLQPIEPPRPPRKTTPMVARLAAKMSFLLKIPYVSRQAEQWRNSEESFLKDSAAADADFAKVMSNWEKEKDAFEREELGRARMRFQQYQEHETDAMLEYWTRVVAVPVYGNEIPKMQFKFDRDQGRLVLTYIVPDINVIPEVASDSKYNLYAKLLERIALSILFRVFQSDQANAVRSAAFNGMIPSIQKATGKEVFICVVAVEAEKASFLDLNFSLLDPSACFASLHGRREANAQSSNIIDPIS